MLTEDPEIDLRALLAVLREHGIHTTSLRFLPIGADGHNYRAEGSGGPWFVSVKRVAAHTEPARDARGLERSYRAARRLREEADIDFLSLALPRADGGYVSACVGRPVVVQRWLDGESHQDLSKHEIAAVLTLVRRLHKATAVVPELDLPLETFDTAFTPVLQTALRRVIEGRDVGPHSAWLRATLADRYAEIAETLAHFRVSREQVLGCGREGWVVTHGEPHGANVVWTPTGPVLVDCGELRLAPPERDLVAMEIGGDEEVTRLYQRRWVLAEIAEYADRLSRPHGDDAEDRRARDQLLVWLEGTG